MVTIRLSRGGAKKRPFYHIVVADVRAKRDGGYIERIGFFNPVAVGGEVRLRVDRARADHWIANGAQPTERVVRLLKDAAKQAEQIPAPAASQSVPAEATAPAS
jgi:small subunit ribosomal protein S16